VDYSVTARRSGAVADEETEGGPVIDAQERFVGLYDSCYRRVLGYAVQHVDASVAEDVASETFLIAWRRLADVPDPPLAWLLAVARNLLRQQYGAIARQRRLETRITALTSADDLLAWDAAEHAIERAAAVEALAALPPDDVETLTLTTSDYSETFYFGYGVHRLSVNQARKLPVTEVALNSLLTRWWNSEPDKQAAVGPAHPNFGQYVFTWAGALLGGPVTQATKAALYRLLAAQPGIQVMARGHRPARPHGRGHR
jgi:DNA-directed RNA polymerase specialized sigma24 family protein